MRKLALLSLTKFSNLRTPAHPFKEFLFASIQQKEVMESCQGFRLWWMVLVILWIIDMLSFLEILYKCSFGQGEN